MGATKISTIITILITFTILATSTSLDTILPSQPINNNQNLTSASGTFQLGFFSPGTSSDRYIGIWFNKIPREFVWVANRESPITTTTGVLHLTSGNLVISASTATLNNTLTWSTNTSTATSAKLLDTGNLVVYAKRTVLWQSFDYPTNALLPEMKLGRDLATNHQWALSSWTSDSDPAPGGFTYTVYAGSRRPPEAYIMNGTTPIWRSGLWDGDGWSGLPAMGTNSFFDYNFTNNNQEVYYSYEVKNQSIVSVVLLGQNGVIQRMVWVGNSWNNYWKITPDQCDTYAFCGSFSVCHNSGAPTVNCNCLRGFVPASELEWGLREWSGGCKRKLDVGCGKGDGFVKVTQLKLPDTANATSNSGKTIDECRDWCFANCSCLAYAMMSAEGGGCINWYGEELMDLRDFSGGGGNDLYLRLAASELDAEGMSTENISHSKKSSHAIIAVPIVLGVIIISIAICIFLVKKRKGNTIPSQSSSQSASASLFAKEEFDTYDLSNDVTKDHDLPAFAFTAIANSTNNFSYETKIGEGGFGPVHKGTLPNGQQIAVKRLSKGSLQGVDEFKNEIKLIANLQHKNLVRLLGCSIKDDERLLVYEYMANRSLDKFLFDPKKSVQLDWQIRIGVIHGVAQGLLYLHKYSRLRIIHRDLKCSNILLDADMNPKISDFGIARIFGGNQDHANTRRVVGTYGYMPPEYAIKGLFSEKSDVFSYGVLLLEVVSGKKNGDFDQVGALLGRAWELWKNGRVTELMDPMLGQSCSLQELTRCVHVGLLCVQEEAAERPTMSSVISFLSSDSTALPSPTNVAFITSIGMNQYTSSAEGYSNSNDITITAIDPR